MDKQSLSNAASPSTSSSKFTKAELDELVRDLKLSKGGCVKLLSLLKEKNLLVEPIDVHCYDEREKEIEPFFSELDGTPFIKNINGLFRWLNFIYEPTEWLLYIRFRNSKLKCFLIHKPKEYKSLPFLLSNEVKDPYQILKNILEIVNYKQHNWSLYGDFKKVIIIFKI